MEENQAPADSYSAGCDVIEVSYGFKFNFSVDLHIALFIYFLISWNNLKF